MTQDNPAGNYVKMDHFGSLQTGVNAALDVANNAPAIRAVINGVGGVWTYWVVTNENHPISAQRVAAIQVAFPLAQQGPNHWGVSLTRNGGVTTVGYLDR